MSMFLSGNLKGRGHLGCTFHPTPLPHRAQQRVWLLTGAQQVLCQWLAWRELGAHLSWVPGPAVLRQMEPHPPSRVKGRTKALPSFISAAPLGPRAGSGWERRSYHQPHLGSNLPLPLPGLGPWVRHASVSPATHWTQTRRPPADAVVGTHAGICPVCSIRTQHKPRWCLPTHHSYTLPRKVRFAHASAWNLPPIVSPHTETQTGPDLGLQGSMREDPKPQNYLLKGKLLVGQASP